MNNIADYDKHQYDYEKYWQDENVKRQYEDRAERIAIKRMIPKHEGWFCDLGAGFGRLFESYKDNFDHFILTDYSLENLKKAKHFIEKKYPQKDVTYIALNAYNLPLKNNSLDCLMSVRLLHHIDQTEDFLGEISRTIKPKGRVIIEYANKRHFFNILKFLIRKSKVNPFSKKTEKHSEQFNNFHPKYIESKIKDQSLKILKILSVSNLRHNFFKKIMPFGFMILKERFLQIILSPIRFGPSVFVLAQKRSDDKNSINEGLVFNMLVCPKCKNEDLDFSENKIKCKECGLIYKIIDNIYDFRV